MEALDKGLLPYWRLSQLFMQDNASIHRARNVLAYLQRHRINTITWPAYSPDLSAPPRGARWKQDFGPGQRRDVPDTIPPTL
jgi:hypothetical protein